ncbi:class I SAM-dependent methyltransferase [Streptomyces atroolivaceus]|uniref:class I SAM-dependent methyltransferase n=1 Tax=Streptomyces atroolivaceus TaxID=66869 RepID=UPI00363507D3
MSVSMSTAQLWVDRWEQQQQRYAIDQEERFTVVADVVEHVTSGHETPCVLDLGCGPGSLPARLIERLPQAEIVAVDMDPLLLALARARHPDAARYVEAVIGEEGWTSALALQGPIDAVVSTTALHYLPEGILRSTYAELRTLLRPGGVLINADHLSQDGAGFAEIAEFVGVRRAERRHAFDHDWETWWSAVENEASSRIRSLAALLASVKPPPCTYLTPHSYRPDSAPVRRTARHHPIKFSSHTALSALSVLSDTTPSSARAPAARMPVPGGPVPPSPRRQTSPRGQTAFERVMPLLAPGGWPVTRLKARLKAA